MVTAAKTTITTNFAGLLSPHTPSALEQQQQSLYFSAESSGQTDFESSVILFGCNEDLSWEFQILGLVSAEAEPATQHSHERHLALEK